MSDTADSRPTTKTLTGLRIAAAIGLVAAIVVVIIGFVLAWWLGLIALAAVPVWPLGFVLVVEAVRR